MSIPRERAAAMASKITAAGSPPCWDMTVTSLRSPQAAQLFARRGAEGVARSQQDRQALRLKVLGELADGGGLAGAVDAGEHDDERACSRRSSASSSGSSSSYKQVLQRL